MDMRENIYLIGFMGCGKSSALKMLQKLAGVPGIEMDKRIETEQGMTISEIFREKGEECFRQIETELLQRITQEGPCIVSCGGGVPMRQENVELMKKSGKVVYLTARPETILKRVSSSHARPLLEGHKNIFYIRDLLSKRRPFYEKAADLRITTDERAIREIAEEILEKTEFI